MQINRFDGGLSTRLHSSLIEPNEAVKYYNVDNTAGTLASIKNNVPVYDTDKPYFYLYKGTQLKSDNPRDYLEYNRNLYWTEDVGAPYKYNGVNTYKLGIDRPVGEPAVDGSGDPIYDDEEAQIIGLVVEFADFEQSDFLTDTETSIGLLPAGTHTYKIFVYVDSKLIFEIPHVATVPANTELTFVVKPQFQMKLGKLDGGVYKQIAITTAGVLKDNGQALGATITDTVTTDTIVSQWTYTYYNSTEDIESAPAELTKEIDWPLAKKVKLTNFTPSDDAQVDIIRLYRIAEPNTTSLMVEEFSSSAIVYYDYKQQTQLTRILDTYSNIPPEPGIYYLVEAYGIFFAAKGNILYFSSVGKPDYWPAQNQIDTGLPITGLLPIDAGILVFSNTGAKLLVGTDITQFKLDPVTNEQGCKNHKSCKLVKNIPCWVSSDGICSWQSGAATVISKDKLGKINLDVVNACVYDETYFVLKTDGSLLAMDLRFGMVFKDLFLTDPIKDIGKFDNILYGTLGNKIAKLFEGDPLALHYVSPMYTEGSITLRKAFNNIYMHIDGEFIVKVFIDKVLVCEQKLTEFGYNDISVEQDKQAGYTLQFEIQGIGEITEIEWKVVGRQNGR